jgi:PST family polysaccharide transporter
VKKNMMDRGNQQTIRLTLKGFSWNVIGNLVRSVAGFIINIILARLLGPEPFGIIAVALLIISIGNLVIESGLGAALIQKEELDKQDVTFVFSIQMAISLVLAFIVVALAPWIANQFGSRSDAPILQIMALILIFQGFTQVPSALLRRELKFKQIQTAQVISFLVGYGGVGLPLALSGYGVWSLVSGQIIQCAVNAAVLFFSARHPLKIGFIGARKLTFSVSAFFSPI